MTASAHKPARGHERWPNRHPHLSTPLDPPAAYLPTPSEWNGDPDRLARIADRGAMRLYQDVALLNDPIRLTGRAFVRMIEIAERANEILAPIPRGRFASAIQDLERDAGPNSYSIFLAIDLFESVNGDPELVLRQADLWLGMVRQCRYEYCISGGRSV